MKTVKYNYVAGLAFACLLLLPEVSQAQDKGNGPQDIFLNKSTKTLLEKGTPALFDHLAARRNALLKWRLIPASELQPVVLRAQAVAKNRGGFRELRVRRFHYIGDCNYAHGGQDAGVNTPTTAQAVFASDIADSYLNQAALLGIPIDSLSIEIHSRPDKEKTDRVAYPRNFLYTVYIDSPASDEQLQELTRLAEANSAVVNFVKAPQNVTADIDYKTSPKNKVVKGLTLPGLREYLQGKHQALEASKKAYEAEKAKNKGKRKAPEEQRGPVVKVFSNGVRQLTIHDKYQILHDNPVYLGGSDLGMTSRENLLGVLATCITHITEIQAATLGVTLDSLAVTVEAQWDPRAGRKGFENVPDYPTDVHYTLHVSTPETHKRIEELQAAVEKVCPIYNLFKDTQTFEARIVRTGREK